MGMGMAQASSTTLSMHLLVKAAQGSTLLGPGKFALRLNSMRSTLRMMLFRLHFRASKVTCSVNLGASIS